MLATPAAASSPTSYPDPSPPTRPAFIAANCTNGCKADLGHIKWSIGSACYDGFTTALPPNTQGARRPPGGWTSTYDTNDENNGGPTYAAITSRSYHPGGVNCPVRRRQRPVHQDHRRRRHLAGPRHGRRRRGRLGRRLSELATRPAPDRSTVVSTIDRPRSRRPGPPMPAIPCRVWASALGLHRPAGAAPADGSATVARPPRRSQTEPVPSEGDAADDPAIWIHPDRPGTEPRPRHRQEGRPQRLRPRRPRASRSSPTAPGRTTSTCSTASGSAGRTVDLAVASVGKGGKPGVKVWTIDPADGSARRDRRRPDVHRLRRRRAVRPLRLPEPARRRRLRLRHRPRRARSSNTASTGARRPARSGRAGPRASGRLAGRGDRRRPRARPALRGRGGRRDLGVRRRAGRRRRPQAWSPGSASTA